MKILHVGNPEAFKNFAICNFLLSRGMEVHYFSPKPVNHQHKGICYHFNNHAAIGKLGILQSLMHLRKVIRVVNPDILHAHNVHSYGWLAALSGFSPLVIHAYGGDVLPEQMQGVKIYQNWLSKYTVRKATRLIVTGNHMVDAVIQHFSIPLQKIEVISRGVDLQLFKPCSPTEKIRLRKKYQIPNETLLLFSPRYLFNSVYNIDITLKAFERISKKFPGIRLLQMHNHDKSDSSYIEIIKLIKMLMIEDRVILRRNIKNEKMPELYNIADICISVPSSDGFPVTVLEASACGVPLVVSGLAYTAEWFEHGVNGLIVEPEDPDALISALEKLINSSEMRRRFSTYNIQKAINEADYTNCMMRLEKLYKELIVQ